MAGYLAFGLAAYGALVGALYLAQRQLLYFPEKVVPDPRVFGVPEMRVVRVITEDGLSLLSWYRPASLPGRPVIVYFCGNAGHIGQRADKVRPYLDAGFGVFLLSYRGYGGNPGSPGEEGFYADGRAALDFLKRDGVASDRIVLYGESLGTGIAVELAKGTPIGALVLEAPFSSIADVAAQLFPLVPVGWLLHDRFESKEKINAVRAPALILHGDQDRTVPIRFGRKLFAAAAEPKEFKTFPGAGHADLYDFGAASVVLDFITRHMSWATLPETPAGP